MKRATFVSMLLLLAAQTAWSAPAGADCPLDQGRQERTARELARHHAGATYEPERGVVAWRDAALGAVSVAVGGCEHFGLWATSDRARRAPSSPAQLARTARALIRAGWPKPFAADAIAALSHPDFEPMRAGDVDRFTLAVPGYDEFVLERSFRHGREHLSVMAAVPG